ncbi:MAG: hypothetical protein ACOWW1_07535 [archaeon]|nr:PQQ-binding-like beta-propeller repeat protein [Candidatus Bathyarchaeum sp.]
MKKILKAKKMIAIVICFIIVATAIISTTMAQTLNEKITYPFIGAVPNPVGVNQEVLLHIGISDYLMVYDEGWEGLTVTVTSPDGQQETLGPYRTDSTGGTGDIFVPTMTGTYQFQTNFPQQDYNGVTYLASVSEPLELIVQEENIEFYPGHSLPTEYWTRPIDAQLREWNQIAGSWLVPNSLMGVSVSPAWIAPYNDGPETGHILWTKELTIGGVGGGETGEHSFQMGDAYEGKWSSPIIVCGKLYYKLSGSQGLEPVLYHCVDLHTGEEMWSKTFLDNCSIAFGQLLYWDGMNSHGDFAYLWVTSGSDYYVFDAYSGDWRFTIKNAPSGTKLFDENGAFYVLQIDTANCWMALWSSNVMCLSKATGYGVGSWGNSVHMNTFDAAENTAEAQSAWIWNVSIPQELTGSSYASFYGDKVIGSATSQSEVTLWGLSLEDGNEGKLLFNETWDAPSEWAEGNLTFPGRSGGWVAFNNQDNVAVIGTKEKCDWYGFSLETGKCMWGPTDPQNYLDSYFGDGRFIANGKFYSVGVSGIVYCYNVQTGTLLWTYEASDPYSEILWANNWWLEPMFLTDGKLYLGHAEHSPINPMPRGAPFICLDADTGDVIWRADGLLRETHWGAIAIIGDSIIASMNTYDQRIYALAKGPSEITVNSETNGVNVGNYALVTGTALDVSPGTTSTALSIRFPNGVPVVADEHMTEWMKYVYQQFECPADATGVSVTVEAVDPNGNYQYLGTTTSDIYGNFGFSFKPEVEGQYTIIATFGGSKAYYGSTSTTYLVVNPATSASIPIDTEEPIDSTEPAEESGAIITTEVAIVTAITIVAIIGVAAYWFIKRK